MRFPSLISMLALPLVLSGCTGVYVQDDPGPRGRYFVGDFDYATGNDRVIETVVTGNPFDMPAQQFGDLVRSLMRHQNRGVPAEFVAGQGARTSPLYKVVVAFNLPRSFANFNMCKNPAALPSQPRAGRLNIAMAFCEGDEVKSDTTGYAFGVQNARDPKFAELVRYTTLYMISDYDPLQDDSGDRSVNP